MRESRESEIAQDLRAMANARTWAGVDGVARAMHALGKWSDEAQSVYDAAIQRLGRKVGGTVRFSERLQLAEHLWPQWLAAHPPLTRERIELNDSIKSAFTAGVMLGVNAAPAWSSSDPKEDD